MFTYRLCAFVAFVGLAVPAFAQTTEQPLPKNLLGFLSVGSKIGIQYVDGATNVKIHVYGDDQYVVARELANGRGSFVNAEAIASKYKSVRLLLDEYKANLKKKASDEQVGETRIYPLMRRQLGIVAGAGDDYVLIEVAGEPKRRMVISRQAISQIYLDANPVRFAQVATR